MATRFEDSSSPVTPDRYSVLFQPAEIYEEPRWETVTVHNKMQEKLIKVFQNCHDHPTALSASDKLKYLRKHLLPSDLMRKTNLKNTCLYQVIMDFFRFHGIKVEIPLQDHEYPAIRLVATIWTDGEVSGESVLQCIRAYDEMVESCHRKEHGMDTSR